MSTFETLFPVPTGGRNADDMGMPPGSSPQAPEPGTFADKSGCFHPTESNTEFPDAAIQDRADAARLDWIERMIAEHASVWLSSCGEELRFVQVRHHGDCTNFPTVKGLRAALDAAIAAALPEPSRPEEKS